MVNLPTVGESSRLNIGEVSALTGISAGRIRHYESRGLLTLDHTESGYRVFSAAAVLRLLHIDLLRTLGMGLEEIRASLSPDPLDVRAALERHREALQRERARVGWLLGAVDQALAEPGAGLEAIVGRLAHAQRESLGVFGRLARPLSEGAAGVYGRLLGEDWGLPVPRLFGQMLLPEPVTELLERLAEAEGNEILFQRLKGLAGRIMALAADPEGTPERARGLGRTWVEEQFADPPPPAVLAVLRRQASRLVDLPVMRDGFMIWAESISPLAAQALRAIEDEARRRGALVLGAVVVPPGRET
ncbi:MAG: MerR family transcriptional regulator [Candidatus Dormibacteraceae bacterium]